MPYGELERTREIHADRSGSRVVVVGHSWTSLVVEGRRKSCERRGSTVSGPGSTGASSGSCDSRCGVH